MKIGIDIHGVIDAYPIFFRDLTHELIQMKDTQIYIVTGRSWREVKHTVIDNDISYTGYYSIVDYHKENKTPMELRESGWWMDNDTWDRSKGDFATRENLDLHFDNDEEYFKWFPKKCKIIPVPSVAFDNIVIGFNNCKDHFHHLIRFHLGVTIHAGVTK